MDNNKNYLYSGKQFRLILVFILTLALVITMIPMSAINNKVDANTVKEIIQSQKTYIDEETFTNGAITRYHINLVKKAPLHINIKSVIAPNLPRVTFDIILKKDGNNKYFLSRNNNTGAKDIVTEILAPGDYYLELNTNSTTNSWGKKYTLKVDTMGNLASSFYVNQGYIVKPYTGKPVNFINSVGYGGKINSPLLFRNQDYSVSYSKGNVKIGTGIITIKGIGGFYGSFNSYNGKYFTYTIKPSKATIYKKKTTISSTRPAKRQLKIKWKKISSANYYQIKYRIKGTTKWKSKTVSGSKTSLTIKKLKKGKKYQYKVRGLQKLKGYTTYYSKYSKTKTSLKIK